jgi:hypothetical protein
MKKTHKKKAIRAMRRKTMNRKTMNRKTTGGMANCSPYSNLHKIHSNTCMTPEIVKKIQTTYNKQHPTIPILSKDTKNVQKTLERVYHCSSKQQDVCLLEHLDNDSLKKEIKHTIFVPKKPKEWSKNPNEWLSNFDILDVLRQYEEAYPFFRFIGPCPIDFETTVNGVCVTRELCSFHIDKSNTKKQIGIIFNLDKHDEPGSHWVSMYIDMDDSTVYYFDSASNELPPEIDSFQKRLIRECEDDGLSFVHNTVEHQRGNTECGMYSLYFIVQMLLCKDDRKRFFQTHFNSPKKRITDTSVQHYRNIYFGD